MNPQTGDHDDPRSHVVHVHNEDNGANYSIPAKGDDKIETIVETLYAKKIKTDRKSDDRLRCETGGEDVMQFSGLSLDAYLGAGHCRDLRWLFAAGTGGA
jgi:hypothetical protein